MKKGKHKGKKKAEKKEDEKKVSKEVKKGRGVVRGRRGGRELSRKSEEEDDSEESKEEEEDDNEESKEEEEEEEGTAKTKTGKHKRGITLAASKPSAAASYPSPFKVGTDLDGGPSLKEADAAPYPATNPPLTKENINPWNAVYVIGLHVYAKDADVTIKLIKPKDDEEAAALDVNRATPAGATM